MLTRTLAVFACLAVVAVNGSLAREQETAVEAFQRLTHRLEAGEQDTMIYLAIARLSEDAEVRDQAITTLERSFGQHPRDPGVAFALYKALMFSRRFLEAGFAAEAVYSRACGDAGATECSDEDRIYVRAYSWVMEADARSQFALSSVGPAFDERFKTDALMLKATETSDSLPPNYRPPHWLTNKIDPNYRGLAPALQMRAWCTRILLEQGRQEEALRVVSENIRMCPDYHPSQTCEVAARVAQEELAGRGIDFEIP